MAAWGDMENFTWDKLELFSWDELERLTLPQIRRVVDTVWPIVRRLSVDEREQLRIGLLDETIPTSVVIYEISDPSAPGVEALFASNKIWKKLKPQSRAEAIAYVSVVVAVLQLGVSLLPETSTPDVSVVIQIMPERLRPEAPTPPVVPEQRDV